MDVEKEIPYFPLNYSGAQKRQDVVCTPLRVSHRFANTLMWSIYTVHDSAAAWSAMKEGGYKKGRNKKESDTLCRVLDLAITEFGHATVEKSAAFEVLLRRLHAVRMADRVGDWSQAMLLEEAKRIVSEPLGCQESTCMGQPGPLDAGYGAVQPPVGLQTPPNVLDLRVLR